MGMTIALAGNPNAGKTTLFNALTGARQHVGNYPGVTVEKKYGNYRFNDTTVTVVDLPGTYSMTAYALDELVARNYLVNDRPETVVNIVDAANLDRNLYLSVQLLEMGLPVVLALNMMDVAGQRGIQIDIRKLSEALCVPVIPMVARNGDGKKELMATVSHMAEKGIAGHVPDISYGPDMDPVLDAMAGELAASPVRINAPLRWAALKFLENDEVILEDIRKQHSATFEALHARADRLARHLKATLGVDPESVIADQRYGYIRSILRNGVMTVPETADRLFISDRIDRVLTHRVLGPAIMVAILWGLYEFTFTFSAIPVGWLESGFGWLSGAIDSLLPDGMLKSMMLSGVIDGVGGVVGFVPLIVFMFLGISMIEDSGYLARMAYMLDRVFRLFGLHGASVMPFIVSGGIAGGCAVPGVMAARGLKSPRERLATLLTVPFMNCGAKLPVFVLLTGAFFQEHESAVMLTITLISWIGALLVAKLLRMTVIRGEATPFVMELPPYRVPTVRGVLIHTWERTWQYIKKAGTVILGISILLWAMMTFPGLPEDEAARFEARRSAITASVAAEIPEPETKARMDAVNAEEAEAALRNSIAGTIGTLLEPVSALAGFDWRTNIALVGGFAAKEVIVSTLGTACSLGEVDPEDAGSLADRLRKNPAWSPIVALSLMIFTIFYAPCSVTVVCIAREAGSWKWGIFSMVFNTVLAFSISVAVFQVGTAFWG